MTDDRSLERAARSWIEVGPTRAPAPAVDAALLRIQTTPQERDLRVPWRITPMPIYTRVAAAVIVGVLVVGGAVYMFSPGGRSSVGVPVPSPVTSPVASPVTSTTPTTTSSPEASRAVVPDAVPQAMWGNWQSPADQSIAGIYDKGEYIQLTIDPNDTRHLWIETLHGGQGFMSTVHQVSADEIKLVTPSAGANQGAEQSCTDGQVGHYRWSKSADGSHLTLTAIDDQCADRISTLSRIWTP